MTVPVEEVKSNDLIKSDHSGIESKHVDFVTLDETDR